MDDITLKWDSLSLKPKESHIVPLTSNLTSDGMNEAVKNAKFDRESFWVQVHDLPIQYMSKVNAEAIGSTLRVVVQVDTGPPPQPFNNFIPTTIAALSETTTTTTSTSEPLATLAIASTAIGDKENAEISIQVKLIPFSLSLTVWSYL
nr:hypothetical protein CFP56_38245 [Quercus suber]